MKTQWDVAVVGAGPAGSAAALVLARAGRRVVLIDDLHVPRRKVGESLPAAARAILVRLGVLDVVERGSHMRSHGNLSSWGSDVLASTDFVRDPHGLGWHLDRAAFDGDLRSAAKDAGAAWISGRVRAVVRTGVRTGDAWRLDIASGGRVSTNFVLDATGRRSAVARMCGATRRRDDDLVALSMWVSHGRKDGDTRTLVEAAPSGWWYTARVPGAARIVAFHVGARDAARILRKNELHAHLDATTHVRELLRDATWLTRPRATEACGACLDRAAGDGWIAAGDAAMAFDPISSQGIFNALYLGMRAGEAAHGSLSGDPNISQQYVRRMMEIRTVYRARHEHVYRSERRWAHEPFWRRRHGIHEPSLRYAL